METHVKVSIGELLDKISILQIKKENIKDANKLLEIEKELSTLIEVCEGKISDYHKWVAKIKEVNQELWVIEDNIRLKEKAKEFDNQFIELARSVYVTNDIRFKIKDEINKFYGSEIKEQKSYEKYQ